MISRLIALVLVILGFGLLTTMALREVGYWGILAPHFQSWGAAQVFADLVILCVLSCLWMITDARKRGIAGWPFIALTLVAGSFGLLLYMVRREICETGKAHEGDSAGARWRRQAKEWQS